MIWFPILCRWVQCALLTLTGPRTDRFARSAKVMRCYPKRALRRNNKCLFRPTQGCKTHQISLPYVSSSTFFTCHLEVLVGIELPRCCNVSVSIYRGQRTRSGISMRSRLSPKRHTSYRPHLSLRLLLGSVVFSLSITITSSLASRPPIPLVLIASVLLACHVYRHSPHSRLTIRFHAALPIIRELSTKQYSLALPG